MLTRFALLHFGRKLCLVRSTESAVARYVRSDAFCSGAAQMLRVGGCTLAPQPHIDFSLREHVVCPVLMDVLLKPACLNPTRSIQL
mmetsp:Transcript_2740/g.7506  ORF Transcript_2740/g.7506 Transcript_2740/m.7506 type:complete len:86 (-) Transcript_2740:373-630(-)